MLPLPRTNKELPYIVARRTINNLEFAWFIVNVEPISILEKTTSGIGVNKNSEIAKYAGDLARITFYLNNGEKPTIVGTLIPIEVKENLVKRINYNNRLVITYDLTENTVFIPTREYEYLVKEFPEIKERYAELVVYRSL